MADVRNEDEKLRASLWDSNIAFGKDCPDFSSPDLRAVKSGLLDRDSALAAARHMPEFVAGLPKAELHLHIEGSLTPARAYAIAKRNGLDLDAFDPEKGAAARREFTSLVPFLIEYGKCSGVMRKEADFYDMMYDYLERAAENGVVHAEIFFDPQTHCYTDVSGVTAEGFNPEGKAGGKFNPNGVGEKILEFKTVITGLTKALEEGRKTLGVDGKLILCFLRDRSVEEALQVLEDARPYMEVKSPVYTPDLLGVGMDNAELGFRPGRFKPAYDKAREAGLHCVAHAGEEGDASYITEALDDLKIERVDHGVRCLEDPAVVERLVKAQTPLTVCPCSNHRLQVYPRFFCGENAVRQLLSRGVKVTVNSDDPAYFFMGNVSAAGRACDASAYDGFLASNYVRTVRDCGLSPDECVQLALNSFDASFISEDDKKAHKAKVAEYCKGWRPACPPAA